MTTFDKREEGFEKQFAHDEELRFKAMARRNKMLGLWAAGVLGKSGADAEAYAKEVVLADFEEAGDNDVLRKVVKRSSAQRHHRAANPRANDRIARTSRRADQKERLTCRLLPSPGACARGKRSTQPGA